MKVIRVESKVREWESKSNGIEVFVYILRNRIDLCAQLILNLEQISLILFGNEVNSQSQVAESSWSSDPVEVSLWCHREIEVNDHIYRDYVYTPGE